MEIKDERDLSKDIFTIPNLISCLRIGLIPVFMYSYLNGGDPWLIFGTVVMSALTDVVDGFIARRFNMVSDIGKALDPIADKLTQFTLMLCLVVYFPHMIFPIILIVVKEVTSGVLGLITLKKTGIVKGAVWHGKLTTVLLYAVMLLHVVWPGITPILSDLLIAVCFGMMLLSFILYVIRYIRTLKENTVTDGKK